MCAINEKSAHTHTIWLLMLFSSFRSITDYPTKQLYRFGLNSTFTPNSFQKKNTAAPVTTDKEMKPNDSDSIWYMVTIAVIFIDFMVVELCWLLSCYGFQINLCKWISTLCNCCGWCVHVCVCVCEYFGRQTGEELWQHTWHYIQKESSSKPYRINPFYENVDVLFPLSLALATHCHWSTNESLQPIKCPTM